MVLILSENYHLSLLPLLFSKYVKSVAWTTMQLASQQQPIVIRFSSGCVLSGHWIYNNNYSCLKYGTSIQVLINL